MFSLFSGLFSKGAEAYKHKETGVELPKAIGSFVLDKSEPYSFENGESGEIVAYNSRNTHAAATIYFRHLPAGMKKTAAELVEEALSAVKELERMGKYSDVKIYSGAGPDGPVGWKQAAFVARSGGSLVMSFIYCSVHKDYAFKIRATVGNPDKAELFEAFVKDVQGRIDKAAAQAPK